MSAISITLATVVLMVGHPVEVRSSTTCPSSQDIAQHLRPLLPASPPQGSSSDLATVEIANLAGADTQLRIRLIRENGSQVGDRQVQVQNDCAEAAATVAAVIAIWEIEPLAPALPGAPLLVGTPAPSGAATSSTWRLLVGAGGGPALVGGTAWAGRLEAIGGKSPSRLQARLGMAGETTRTGSLAPGSVAWRHTTFEGGMLLRTLHPVWSWSLDAGLALGWATLAGRGFDSPRESRAFEYGAVAALRLALSLGHWQLWAEGRAYGWVQGQRASLGGGASGVATPSADLPLLDMTASLGLSAPILW